MPWGGFVAEPKNRLEFLRLARSCPLFGMLVRVFVLSGTSNAVDCFLGRPEEQGLISRN